MVWEGSRVTFCLPGGSDGKESSCNVGDWGLISGVRNIPWRREWLPVFLPGVFRGQRSLGDTVHGVTKRWT